MVEKGARSDKTTIFGHQNRDRKEAVKEVVNAPVKLISFLSNLLNKKPERTLIIDFTACEINYAFSGTSSTS